jgi:hypothetical protein
MREDCQDLPLLGQSHLSFQEFGSIVWQKGSFQGVNVYGTATVFLNIFLSELRIQIRSDPHLLVGFGILLGADPDPDSGLQT